MSLYKTIIEETAKTPLVEFNSGSGHLKISGKIISENPLEFFNEMDSMIDFYNVNKTDVLQADIYLNYFNTICSKYFLKFLKKIVSSNDDKTKVLINWHYETDDTELLEAGTDYSMIINYPFNLIEVKN